MKHILRTSRSLAKVLIWPYIVLIIILSLLVGLLSYSAGRQGVMSVADRMLQETAERVGLAVDRHVVGAAAVLQAGFPVGMAARESIDPDLAAIKSRFWIATSLNLDANNYVYYGNRQGQFIGLFRHTLNDAELRIKYQTDPFRSAYRFYGIDDALGAPATAETDFDPRTRPWFARGKDADGDVWSDIYINFWEKDLVITRLRRVLSNAGTFEGVVATDVSLTALSDFLKTIRVSPRSVAFVIEANGNLIASSDGTVINQEKDGQVGRLNARDSQSQFIKDAFAALGKHIQQPAGHETGERTFSFEGPHGEPVYGAYAFVRDNAGLSWMTVVVVPSDDFLGVLNKNARWTVVIGGIGIFLALLIGFSIVNWVVRDVRRLSKAATRIGEGQMNVTLDIERRDEIGQLATNFMDMQKELSTDKLTGLTSRSALVRYLDALIQQGHAMQHDTSAVFTVMFLDLNRFKAINDTLGHQYGDLALIEVGQRFKRAVRENDIVARYGGDEFVIVFVGVANPQFTEQIRRKLNMVLSAPLTCLKNVEGGENMTVGAAMGVAYFPLDGRDYDTLLKHADHAMYNDKMTTEDHR